MGRNRHGANGEDVVLKVPVGTQVFDEDKETLIVDLDRAGHAHPLAKGGNGGFGNARFKGPINRAPATPTPARTGEERWIWLRLKLIADVGLVGLPNAGKSTFLAAAQRGQAEDRRLSVHHPHPQPGVVDLATSELRPGRHPGPDRGRHEGAGLGTRSSATSSAPRC